MKLRQRNGIWQADLRAEGMGRYSTGCTSKADAKQWALDRLKGTGRAPENTDHTLGDALSRALAEHYEPEHSKGLRAHRSTIGQLMDEIGSTRLPDVTTPVLMAYTEGLRKHGLSGATINRRMAYVSKALRLANMWGWLTGTPVIPRFKESQARHREVSPAEEDTLVQLLYNTGAGGLVIFLLHTGARVSEALAITEVDRRRALDSGRWTIWENKSNRVREVPLNDKARMALLMWQWKGYTYAKVQQHWERARQTMGLTGDPGFTLHCLRHTCASRLVQAGVHLLVVKDILGHSSTSVTERYAHASPGNIDQAMRVLV